MSDLVRIAAKIASEPYFQITEAWKTEDGTHGVRISEDPEDDYGSITAELSIRTYYDKGAHFLEGVNIYDIEGATDDRALEKWVTSNEYEIADRVFDLTSGRRRGR